MICSYIINKVTVYQDYKIQIEFSISVEQFLNEIDSLEECDANGLPMAK